MHATTHVEQHFTASAVVRDIVIGMSDGLTVPFALAAGLTGAVSQTAIIVTAGLAEIAAGSIAMGLGGYLAARTDQQHYEAERIREEREIRDVPDVERTEVADVLVGFGLTQVQAAPVVEAIAADPRRWVDFMMKFELGLEPIEPTRARNSALTIACSYIVGGLIPLMPYVVAGNVRTGLGFSIALTVAALVVFGGVKAMFTGVKPWRGALQTALTGSLAAGAAYAIASLFG